MILGPIFHFSIILHLSRLGTHYLCRSSERLDDELELEVIDEEKKIGDGKASKTKDDGSEVG
jgi:hypothetical protein